MALRLDSEWRSERSCHGLDPRRFFADRGRLPNDATDLCTACPVRRECLDFALSSPWEPQGIWGGLHERELIPMWHQRSNQTQSETDLRVRDPFTRMRQLRGRSNPWSAPMGGADQSRPIWTRLSVEFNAALCWVVMTARSRRTPIPSEGDVGER